MKKSDGGYLLKGLHRNNPSSDDLGVKTPKQMTEMGASEARDSTAPTPRTLGPRTA